MDAGILIPILVPLGMFAMIFGIFYIRNRERMAMIEKGMDPREHKPHPAPWQNLKWGLLLIGSGLGLFVAYILDRTAFTATQDENEALYFGLVAVFGGFGLVISYVIEKKELYANYKTSGNLIVFKSEQKGGREETGNENQ
ncbi:DUF6249 domain-containing protein [Mucilaginibacter conchicola]|uniref:DUF6249 domain-containing protein n=1 Tax=Mucilaginibacter conchicola TaxID=2303333 RepID=UPI0018F59885|nr:DUF6249 domain-containing protein [Mucilaginibacter conchicola]